MNRTARVCVDAAAPRAAGRVSLSEQAYVAIKQLILRGDIKGGERVTEGMLCERLSLGRNPVHIAVHRLHREGLVEIVPRKNILVRGETIQSFIELWNARLLVEPYLTELAAARADEHLVDELRGLLAVGRKRHRAGDRRGCMEIDRAVHQRIYEASGNRLLADFASVLLDRSMRLWFAPFAGRYEEDDKTMDELAALIEAIEAREPVAARRLMSEHIGSLRAHFARLQQGIDTPGTYPP